MTDPTQRYGTSVDRRGSGSSATPEGSPGLVFLVGAGPGDPELITIKGARALASADAVVHDRLVSPDVLDLAPRHAVRYDAGKEGHGHCVPQEDTNALLVRLARAGLRVVRLKGGDPFVYGRGGEEASALAEAGIPFVIVPGVSAGVAGPAYAGIPVTDRRFARSVAFITAHQGPTAGAPDYDWAALSRIDTLVVFMAGARASEVGRLLVAAGRDATTPVAIIRSASLPEQRVEIIDLETLGAAGTQKSAGPTMLVIGAVVDLAHELAWFDPSLAGSLAGWLPEPPAATRTEIGERRPAERTTVRGLSPAEVTP